MIRITVLLLSLLLVSVAHATFSMDFIRMCAAFPNESCSELATVPGPCHNPQKCVDMACDPTRPGNCVADPSLDGCDEILCPVVARQQSNVIGRLSRRFVRTA